MRALYFFMKKSLFQKIWDFLDERYDVGELFEKEMCKKIPKLTWTYCFGGAALFFFQIQVITGILLLIYYRPTIAEAYASVINITNNIPFGWLIRGFHAWGANLMIIALLLHMGRVFYQGSYKNPRELNWVIGVGLFTFSLTFSFTGYLLPWTQLSYWATVVGTEIPGAIPVAGPYIKAMIRGGEEISQYTLSRFYALHVVILPAVLGGALMLHLLIVKTVGISEPVSEIKKREKEKV